MSPCSVCGKGCQRFPAAHYGEESCAVRLEEGPNDDCRYAVDCSANVCKNFFYCFVNNVDRTGHPGCHRTGHTRRLLYIGHRDIRHDGRPISYGCRGSSSSRRRNIDDSGIVVARYARYPDVGMTNIRLVVSMYFEA